jgi:hypothetical protein
MNSQKNNSEANTVADDQFCQMCGIPSTQRVITEVAPTNAESATKLIMCAPCLSVHNLSLLCVSEKKKIKEDERFVTELQVNRRKEARFRLFVLQELSKSEQSRLEETDLINSGAEFVGISPITARRYINKLTSTRGVLTRIDDGQQSWIEFIIKKEDFE